MSMCRRFGKLSITPRRSLNCGFRDRRAGKLLMHPPEDFRRAKNLGADGRPRRQPSASRSSDANKATFEAWHASVVTLNGWLTPGSESRMNRDEVLDQLARHKPTLVARYGVDRLALFGSTVRDTARADSDIDILVSFDGPATSERYFGVQFILEDLLGRPVDLVTDKALRPELRAFIEREAVHV